MAAVSPAPNAAHLGAMNPTMTQPCAASTSPSARPVPTLTLDTHALTTAQFVMGTHADGPFDTEDTLAVYTWSTQSAALLCPGGPRVYANPREAAAFLHTYRAERGRDLPCLSCD